MDQIDGKANRMDEGEIERNTDRQKVDRKKKRQWKWIELEEI